MYLKISGPPVNTGLSGARVSNGHTHVPGVFWGSRGAVPGAESGQNGGQNGGQIGGSDGAKMGVHLVLIFTLVLAFK